MLHVHCTATEKCLLRKGEQSGKNEIILVFCPVKWKTLRRGNDTKKRKQKSLPVFKTASNHVRQNCIVTSALISFRWVQQGAEGDSFSLLLLLWLSQTPCPEFGYCLVCSLSDIKSKHNIHVCGHILTCVPLNKVCRLHLIFVPSPNFALNQDWSVSHIENKC